MKRLSKTIVIPEAPSPIFRPLDRSEIAPTLRRYGIDFPYILYVGSSEARKNLARLLDAFARLLRGGSRTKLVIAGAHDRQASQIAHTIVHLALEHDVHFTGPVQDEDLPALYCGAALFVFPSLIEGFGLPVIEAMACGTPVVTSKTASLPEITADAALLVDPRDPAALAAAMRQVLDDPVLAHDLRLRGLARAREFSWEQTARQMTSIYEKVLAQRSGW